MLQKTSTTPSFDEHFTIANIPFGVVSIPNDSRPQIATRLYGDVFIIPKLIEKGLLGDLQSQVQDALLQPSLNHFASLGRPTHTSIRQKLQNILKTWTATVNGHSSNVTLTNGNNSDMSTNEALESCSHSISSVTTHLPIHPRDFSDFSCSKDHVLNAGEAVTGVRSYPPGFLHFPVGYGGRCSSIVPSGTKIRRPKGQFRDKSKGEVVFGPSKAVDFELEVACVIGWPSEFGKPVKIEDADEHIFGLVLLNDWSARDIQGLEMNPLGPFNGKSFGTTISPWIITIDALEPFQCPSLPKELPVAPYLHDTKEKPSYSIQLQASIEAPTSSNVVCSAQFEWMYWTLRDMIAHQTINGCPLSAGDFLATGTVSGSQPGSHGCLLEITKGGKEVVTLGNGETRTYLQDGDAVRLSGWAGDLGSDSCVGFGECYGTLCEALGD